MGLKDNQPGGSMHVALIKARSRRSETATLHRSPDIHKTRNVILIHNCLKTENGSSQMRCCPQQVRTNVEPLVTCDSDPEETTTDTLSASDTVSETTPTGTDSGKLALL